MEGRGRNVLDKMLGLRRMRIERRNFVCLIRTARETKGIGREREGQWDSDGRDREMGLEGGD